MEIETVPITTQNQIIVQRLYESGFKPSEIMELEINGLKRATVFDQCKMLKEGQKLRPKGGAGRPYILTDEDIIVIADYMNENPDACAPEIRKHVLDTTGVEVCEETIRRTLKGLGLAYKESKSVSLLTEKAKENRLKWAKEYRGRSFNKVVFTDEATFWLGKTGVARWKPTQDTNEHMVPKNIPKLQVWGAISINGKVDLRIFKENLDAPLYAEILEEKLPQVKNLFRSVSAWSWQQDNDPKHTSNIAMKWFREKRIRLIDWPSYSPDLNPIENVWGYIKKKIAKRRPRTLAELEENLLELWNGLSNEYLESLIQSMSKRVELLIDNKGDRISY